MQLSFEHVLSAMRCVVVSDSNKSILKELGLMHLLLRIIEGCQSYAKLGDVATSALLELSFDDDVIREMVPLHVPIISALDASGTGYVADCAEGGCGVGGIGRVCEEEMLIWRLMCAEGGGKGEKRVRRVRSGEEDHHVFISCSTRHTPEFVRLGSMLRAKGCRVSYGHAVPLSAAVGETVEHGKTLVTVCVLESSRAYKECAKCRFEGTEVMRSGKAVVVAVRPKASYQACGWQQRLSTSPWLDLSAGPTVNSREIISMSHLSNQIPLPFMGRPHCNTVKAAVVANNNGIENPDELDEPASLDRLDSNEVDPETNFKKATTSLQHNKVLTLMTVEDVSEWLRAEQMPTVRAVFIEHCVCGLALTSLLEASEQSIVKTTELLCGMGIAKVGHALRLLQITKLRALLPKSASAV